MDARFESWSAAQLAEFVDNQVKPLVGTVIYNDYGYIDVDKNEISNLAGHETATEIFTIASKAANFHKSNALTDLICAKIHKLSVSQFFLLLQNLSAKIIITMLDPALSKNYERFKARFLDLEPNQLFEVVSKTQDVDADCKYINFSVLWSLTERFYFVIQKLSSIEFTKLQPLLTTPLQLNADARNAADSQFAKDFLGCSILTVMLEMSSRASINVGISIFLRVNRVDLFWEILLRNVRDVEAYLQLFKKDLRDLELFYWPMADMSRPASIEKIVLQTFASDVFEQIRLLKFFVVQPNNKHEEVCGLEVESNTLSQTERVLDAKVKEKLITVSRFHYTKTTNIFTFIAKYLETVAADIPMANLVLQTAITFHANDENFREIVTAKYMLAENYFNQAASLATGDDDRDELLQKSLFLFQQIWNERNSFTLHYPKDLQDAKPMLYRVVAAIVGSGEIESEHFKRFFEKLFRIPPFIETPEQLKSKYSKCILTVEKTQIALSTAPNAFFAASSSSSTQALLHQPPSIQPSMP